MTATGTRTRQAVIHTRIDHGSETRSHTRDVGMSKNITASTTFVSSPTSQAQAANGTFANFAVNDVLLVEGVNLNNGFFTVVGIDSANHAYLVLDPPPKSEGPTTATVRTV